MDQPTRPSLLERLRDAGDNAAWDEFLSLYGGLIRGYARKKGCSDARADDVCQETLVRLLRRLPGFVYQPRGGHPFRSLLLRITHGCIVDEFRREGRYAHPDGADDGASPGFFGSIPDDGPEAGQDWDKAWLESVLAQALNRVRQKVKGTTYQAFCAYVIAGEAADEVAADVGLNANALYRVANRVKDLLRREVKGILADAGEEGGVDVALLEAVGLPWQPELQAAYRQTLDTSATHNALRDHLRYVQEALERTPTPDEPGVYLLVMDETTARWHRITADTTIGASADTGLRLESPGVSRRHARVERVDDLWRIVDLGSTNSVLINGQRSDEHPLRDGDVIQLGKATLVFLRVER